MDTVLLSSILTGIAVFSLLMFIFEPWLFPPQPKLDAVRASVLSRERYERLVVAERPWWERLVAPIAARLGSSVAGPPPPGRGGGIHPARVRPARRPPARLHRLCLPNRVPRRGGAPAEGAAAARASRLPGPGATAIG